MAVQKGLENVIAAESSICKIDGASGQLWYRGYNINDLATASYEEVCYLLVYGKLPNRHELRTFDRRLKDSRSLPSNIMKEMKTFSRRMSPMEALRTTVSSLSQNEKDLRFTGIKHNVNIGIDLIAKFPTIVAAYKRLQAGKKPLDPKNDLSHAGNLLYMLNGSEPTDVQERAINTDLVLHADHGFNASTFTARIATSTMADIYSSIVAGICTLRGPLHGGAAQETMRMLREIKNTENAERYVINKLREHQRIMGFGHRVYRTMDPRARILKAMAVELCTGRNKKWIEIQQVMENVMRREKNLFPNVDFYSATVYNTLGFPLDLDTPMFACGRIPGWVAHCLEQRADNRLIRPKSQYTGTVGLNYVSIDKRK